MSLEGWDSLRHKGLLLDATRQQDIAALDSGCPEPLPVKLESELRKRVSTVLAKESDATKEFIPFVLGQVCGLDDDTHNSWLRGSNIPKELSRKTPTGDSARPQHIWQGPNGAEMLVFTDSNKSLGIGEGRRAASRVLHWLRASGRNLAVLTNGRHWRLIFAGFDYDAYCEWDIDLWHVEGSLSDQASLFRRLLHPKAWTPKAEGEYSPLLKAIFDSRKGDPDFSMILGEKIRLAVELLIREHTVPLKQELAGVGDHSTIYRAATRVIMRLVVVLFAESRNLLPSDHPLYRESYSIIGLAENLRGARLASSHGAWPRILALFKLIHGGSYHRSIPIPAYGGELFAPHDTLPDGIFSKILGVFEQERTSSAHQGISDKVVLEMLDLMTRTTVKLKQGRGGNVRISVPVDFSSLSSDYIGILYEGLLDFELMLAPEDDSIVFLGINQEPALPLKTLESLDSASIKKLLGSKKEDEDSESDLFVKEEAESLAEDIHKPDDQILDGEGGDATQPLDRAHDWAKKVARTGNLLSKKNPSEEEVERFAKKTIKKVVSPGEFYLVRWGGTRKGSGTFYTPLGIVAPTVKRTLAPLVQSTEKTHDGSCGVGLGHRLVKPEEILSLKVVDPACGSGAFLVAATRFLTNTLYESLHHHQRIQPDGNKSIVRLLGLAHPDSEESISEEKIPCRPEDPQFEIRLKGKLCKWVVEHCIYGVDLDQLAIELCKMAIWIEMMNKELQFSFLDHKIKCGNSLVGTWFDEFHHYPPMAWRNRESEDAKHKNCAHYPKEALKKSLRIFVKEKLKPNLCAHIEAITADLVPLDKKIKAHHNSHRQIRDQLEHIHNISSDPMKQTEEYEKLIHTDEYCSLAESMDLWCSCWFWPLSELDHAPLPTELHEPSDAAKETSRKLRDRLRYFHWELEFPDVFRSEKSGFDAVVGNPPWDVSQPKSIEFFSRIDPLYSLYTKQEALRKQKNYFVDDEETESDWLKYIAQFRALSNFVSHCFSPFGDPQQADKPICRFPLGQRDSLHDKWRAVRTRSHGFASPVRPYQYQGKASLNLYKLFLERGHHLLKEGGRMGFLVPSGIHSDSGTRELRELFLNHSRWEWAFGFINSEKIFPSVDSRFKADVIIVQKGGNTDAVNTAFERSLLEDWENGEKHIVPYTKSQIRRYSPLSNVLVEVHGRKDLEVLERVYSKSAMLGGAKSGWGIQYKCEFHMTGDSGLFNSKDKLEQVENGYCPDEYSRWLKGKWRGIDDFPEEIKRLLESEVKYDAPPYNVLPFSRAVLPEGIILSRNADAWMYEDEIEDIALPLYQGRMIGQFDFSAKGYVSGSGKYTIWDEIPWDMKQIRPQFLVKKSDFYNKLYRGCPPGSWLSKLKVGMMEIGGSTNTRSMTSAPIIDCPCGHKVPTLILNQADAIPTLVMLLNSYAYDWVLRSRLGGLSMSWFVLEETPLPLPGSLDIPRLKQLALSIAISMSDIRFACMWESFADHSKAWRAQWAITPHERMRLTVMCNAISFSLFGYDLDAAHHAMMGCDLPLPFADQPAELQKLRLPSGFWRVDKDKVPEFRQSVLSLVAFHDLQALIDDSDGDRSTGIEKFLAQNEGVGWMLPCMLRLSDYGLGHDQRAKEQQPVACKLGPRFLAWQLQQKVEESWKECRLHARNFLGKEAYEDLLASKRGERIPSDRADQLPLEFKDDPSMSLFRS